MRLSEAMTNVSKLLGNLGTADRSTNFILEQRSLMKAQAKENKEVRELIENEIVDGLAYVRVREQIAQTKQRVKHLLELSDDEDTKQESESTRDAARQKQIH